MNKAASVWCFMWFWPCFDVCGSDEPIIGGPCDGCEYVFSGMPQELSSEARIAPAGEPGESMVITGTVRSQAGAPAENIIVYAYQTNAKGRYPRGKTRHGRLRAWVKTDGSGEYRFYTVRPGSYPGRDIAQHVHMHVIEPGKATYYISDVLFLDDPLLSAEDRRRAKRARGGNGLSRPTRDADGVWQVRRDIILGQNIPDYK